MGYSRSKKTWSSIDTHDRKKKTCESYVIDSLEHDTDKIGNISGLL